MKKNCDLSKIPGLNVKFVARLKSRNNDEMQLFSLQTIFLFLRKTNNCFSGTIQEQ